LAEVEIITVPFGLGEGHYRLWGRLDNSTGQDRTGWGISIDQHLTPEVTVFGRYGNGDVGGTRVHFFDAGLGFQAPFTFNPLDRWGIGYAQTEIVQRPTDLTAPNEKLIEGFYNLHLTDHLAVSMMLQYVMESGIGSNFFIPGLRMGVTF
jgi:high affinity Mn2+ porin